MSSERRLSRRTLLGAAGAAVAATALPVVPALSPLSAEAAAADPQTNLEKLVNMRFDGSGSVACEDLPVCNWT